jgi:hypothetical protein
MSRLKGYYEETHPPTPVYEMVIRIEPDKVTFVVQDQAGVPVAEAPMSAAIFFMLFPHLKPTQEVRHG